MCGGRGAAGEHSGRNNFFSFTPSVESGVVRGYVLLEALALPHQRPLQDDAALLVALAVLRGELVDPAQLAVAVLAADVAHHVSAREHDAVLHLAVLEVHHLVEKEGSARGSGEARGDELGAVGQDGVAVGTGEEARPSNVVQEDAAHGQTVVELLC